MSVLPWNFRKFSCKIYPFPWNFLVKITLPHVISILNLALSMEFPCVNYPSLWNFHHGTFTPGNFPLTYVLPWNFHPIKFTPPFGNSM
jgi:hypothetical protein